jgi:hypothetical protein
MRNKPDPFRVTSAQLARAMRWPIGTAVTLTLEDGTTIDTATRSAPWKGSPLFPTGTWVILVEAKAGGYALARVTERAEVC